MSEGNKRAADALREMAARIERGEEAVGYAVVVATVAGPLTQYGCSAHATPYLLGSMDVLHTRMVAEYRQALEGKEVDE